MKTDWEALSRKLGVLKPDGSELYMSKNSAQALEEILGDEWLQHTLDTFIEGTPGNELAIKTLRYIGSEKAAKMAYQIFSDNKETNIQKARMAIWALSDIRTALSMDYVEEFIKYKRFEGIAIAVLRNLIFDNALAFEKSRLIKIFDTISDEYQEDIIPLREFVKKEFEA